MSEQTTNTESKPKAARKRTPKDAPVTLSSVVQTIASKRDMDATKCGKLVRSYIRGHDADLRKAFKWPPNDKQRADGNRYPPMPRKAADALQAHFVK
jgi:hypothetical protein